MDLGVKVVSWYEQWRIPIGHATKTLPFTGKRIVREQLSKHRKRTPFGQWCLTIGWRVSSCHMLLNRRTLKNLGTRFYFILEFGYNKPTYREIVMTITKIFQVPIPNSALLMKFKCSFNKVSKKAPVKMAKENFIMTEQSSSDQNSILAYSILSKKRGKTWLPLVSDVTSCSARLLYCITFFAITSLKSWRK